MVLLFLQFLVYVTGKEIVYSFDAQAQNKDYWVDNPPFFQCDDGQYIFGKFNMNGVLMRNFELPPHFRIYIDLIFYRIDSWDNDQFTIYLDNQLLFEQAYTFTTGTSNLCGVAAYNDEKIQISFQAQHNSNFAVVAMKAQDVNGDNNELWGIRAFTLSIEPCRSNFSIINLSNLECLYVSIKNQNNLIIKSILQKQQGLIVNIVKLFVSQIKAINSLNVELRSSLRLIKPIINVNIKINFIVLIMNKIINFQITRKMSVFRFNQMKVQFQSNKLKIEKLFSFLTQTFKAFL